MRGLAHRRASSTVKSGNGRNAILPEQDAALANLSGCPMLVPMKVDYGLRILVDLAQQPEGVNVSSAEIAARQYLPEPYLLQIAADLQRAGLIRSKRGPRGGHTLALPADSITVADVVASLDRTLAPLICLDEPEECTLSGACSQRELWSEIEGLMLAHLRQIYITDLARRQKVLAGSAA